MHQISPPDPERDRSGSSLPRQHRRLHRIFSALLATLLPAAATQACQQLELPPPLLEDDAGHPAETGADAPAIPDAPGAPDAALDGDAAPDEEGGPVKS